ncbi:OFA family MFS transporter [Methanorbis furvi]|uniref:L-lactate transporter n=1 Tax=Methanorbis furvi TaxID=3028299 RepID=A0AAE4M9W8_9EURY|nr:L-lactate transporter [Methanocorpusculaceae archaeon Ag1]
MIELKSNRWLVLLAGFIFNFCLSGTSAFSTFVSPVMDTTGWDMGSVTLAYTFYNIMICVFGIVIGVLGPRINSKLLMYVGATLFAAGWIITGFATEIWMFWLGFGIIAGIGGGCLYNFSVTNTLKWFPDKKGLISGLLLGGAAIGPVFSAPLATALLGDVGVMASYQIIGIIYGILMFAVGWMVSVPPANYKPDGWEPDTCGTSGAANVVSTKDYTWNEMLKTPTFWLLFLVFAFACTPYMMMLSAVSTIGQQQAGMTLAMAAIAVSLLAISNFVGRLLFGAVSDKLGRYKTLLIAVAIDVIAIVMLGTITEPIPFMAVMCILGACGGALLVMFPPITSDNFGSKNSGLNYAIMFVAYSMAALIGPQLLAYFKNTTGAYTLAFSFSAGLMLVAGVILFIVMFKRKRECEYTT